MCVFTGRISPTRNKALSRYPWSKIGNKTPLFMSLVTVVGITVLLPLPRLTGPVAVDGNPYLATWMTPLPQAVSVAAPLKPCQGYLHYSLLVR